MSTALYDKALLNKLNMWTDRTSMQVYGPDDLRRTIEVHAEKNKDKPLKLPLVTLRRKPGFELVNPNRAPLAYNGIRLQSQDENNSKIHIMNAIPINIEYQLDVYCKKYEEADAYIRNFVFNFLKYPNLPIVIPYENVNYVHNSTVRISNEIEDNSNIPERLVTGQFTRLTLNVSIDDAYLWDVENVTIKSINQITVDI